MNVSNAAMGTGVLAFPLAYKQAGWLFGTILTLVYGVIMTTTLIIIARAARQYDAISYQDLLGQMFGPKTKIFLMCTLPSRPTVSELCRPRRIQNAARNASQHRRLSFTPAATLPHRYCRGICLLRQRLVSQCDDRTVHSHLAAVDQVGLFSA
jgi:hypothetical protein